MDWFVRLLRLLILNRLFIDNGFLLLQPQEKLSVEPDAFFPSMNPDHKNSDELNGDTFGNMDVSIFQFRSTITKLLS